MILEFDVWYWSGPFSSIQIPTFHRKYPIGLSSSLEWRRRHLGQEPSAQHVIDSPVHIHNIVDCSMVKSVFTFVSRPRRNTLASDARGRVILGGNN